MAIKNMTGGDFSAEAHMLPGDMLAGEIIRVDVMSSEGFVLWMRKSSSGSLGSRAGVAVCKGLRKESGLEERNPENVIGTSVFRPYMSQRPTRASGWFPFLPAHFGRCWAKSRAFTIISPVTGCSHTLRKSIFMLPCGGAAMRPAWRTRYAPAGICIQTGMAGDMVALLYELINPKWRDD
ncbi:MAG: hypothetical protein ACOX8S_11525 [Christensenellales bacterium]|jgi:hypothetical protein